MVSATGARRVVSALQVHAAASDLRIGSGLSDRDHAGIPGECPRSARCFASADGCSPRPASHVTVRQDGEQ